jgi:hypothetical protein
LPRLLSVVLLLAVFLPAVAQEVTVERVTEHGGFVDTCGSGPGLSPCRDVNGETYEEEVGGQDVAAEDDTELAAEAARIRGESPQELQGTVTEMEQGAW